MPDDLAALVAAEVRRLCDEREWSGRELARRTGIHYATLSRKLAGTSPFDLRDLGPVAAAFDITPEELVAWARR